MQSCRRRGRSSITPTATAISAGSATRRSTAGGCANGCPERTTSTSSAISTTGSGPKSACSATATAYGAPSSPRRCTATGWCTARSTSSTSMATTAGWTAFRPTRRAWCRTRRPKTTRRSSGRRSRSTGGATHSTFRKTGTCSSTRHTWAWRRRRRASGPTANSRRRYYL